MTILINFGFQITEKEIEDRALKLTVFDVDRDKKHQVIGHVVFLFKVIFFLFTLFLLAKIKHETFL